VSSHIPVPPALSEARWQALATPEEFSTTLVAYSKRVGDGVVRAGDGTLTRDIQLGRKDATAQAVRVFKKALDASMAHFLWLANVFL